MIFFGKITFFVLFLCALVVRGRSLNKNGVEDVNEKIHSIEKRSLELKSDDGVFQREFENAFERPHRLRVLPGFLH